MLCCKGCHTNHTPRYRLAKNYIGTDGAVSLAKQLKYNTSLTHLEYVAMQVATRGGLMLTCLCHCSTVLPTVVLEVRALRR